MKKIRLRSYSGSMQKTPTLRETENRQVARLAAAEGIVMLKNEGILPLDKGKPLAILGSGAYRLIKGGTGSGDVNEREVVSIYEGLKNAGVPITSNDWIADYARRYEDARFAWRKYVLEQMQDPANISPFTAYARNPFPFPKERPIQATDVQDAHAAIYVISRVAGEAKDRMDVPGDYYLSESEAENLRRLCMLCQNVIVLINSGAQIHLGDILCHEQVKALLFIGQPGMEGGNAVADVLLGKVNPSGRLTDTWAKAYKDFPNSDTFSYKNQDVQQERYHEDIYVGYRYFDTFGITTEYPFGYGCSYTSFSIQTHAMHTENNRVTISLSVTNTGPVAGKEVVQIYVSCPQSGLPKEHRRLCAFGKTQLLQPAQTQHMQISFPVKMLASYSECLSAWVVEEGKFGIWVGRHIEDLSLSGVLVTDATAVLEQVTNICPMKEDILLLERPRDRAMAFEQLWRSAAAGMVLKEVPLKVTPIPDICRNEDMLEVEAAAIAAQLTCDERIRLCIGAAKKGSGGELGAAGLLVPGAAGETAGGLEKYNIARVVMADGPAGLRLMKKYDVDRETGNIETGGSMAALEGGFFLPDTIRENADTYYQYCVSFPVGVMLAQTWNPDLIEACGRSVGLEMEAFGVSWWLAPGMNIHRNPLCGRNFEYYSEDPLVSGVIAAAMTKGVQSVPGVGTTIKHFACNNQEENRMGSNSILSERALREIYLRGFEIAVKSSQPMAIMTSYNMINGIYAANSSDLCTQVARKEWGFCGIIMTDWSTTLGNGSVAWKCIRSGNDLIMPGAPMDYENIRQALSEGVLSEDQVQNCTKRLIRGILQTNAYEDCVSYSQQFQSQSAYIQVI